MSIASRTSFVLTIAATVFSHAALAFECSLSAEGAAATVVRPTGESVRLGMRKEKECQGIRVSAGAVRIVYAGASGLQETVLSAGAVVNPGELKPVSDSAFSAALRQLGLVLAGDVRQRPGMLRGAELQPDDYAEMLPQGTILWNAAGIVIALPAQHEQSLRGLRIADAGGRDVALEKTSRGYRIPPGNLQQGARYEWSATADGKPLRGVFTVSTAARAADTEQQAGTAGEAPSAWRTVLVRASSLAAQGLVWDAGRVIRESL